MKILTSSTAKILTYHCSVKGVMNKNRLAVYQMQQNTPSYVESNYMDECTAHQEQYWCAFKAEKVQQGAKKPNSA